MKHISSVIISLLISSQSALFGQLPDGATAPNWTLTDIDGNTHTLYDYLDQGKMVVMEFSATWCGPCWNYMLTGALENFWNVHGPDGLDDAMVFYIEADQFTGMADLLGQTASSQGNWVAAIPFPIIDLQFGQNVDNQYLIAYYPTLYAICSDATIYELGQVSSQVWGNFVQSCTLEAEAGDTEPAVCFGDGSASVEATGGIPPYGYHWSTGESTQTITGLGGGNYGVTVTEAYGKISSLNIFVPGPTEPLTISNFNIEPALCFGSSSGSIAIDVGGGTPGYQYDWSNGANTQNIIHVPADVYDVTITDNHDCTHQQSFFVNEPDALEVEIEATVDNCEQSDGTVTLDISGGVGDYVISASTGIVNGNSIIGLSAGEVSVEVEDENGCTWIDVITIESLDAPDVQILQGGGLNCIQSTTTLSGFPSGGNGEFDFYWSTSNGHIVSSPVSSTITVDEPGLYVLSVTDIINGCETFALATVISNIVLPGVDAGPGIPINCESTQVTLAGTGDALNSVIWSTDTGNIVSGGSTYNPIVNAPGMYYIEVTSPFTNCSNQDSVFIPDEASPANSIFEFVTNGLTMSGFNLSTGSNLSGWNWTFGDGATSGDINVIHTYTLSGVYQVCLSVLNGCGVNQSCQMVEVTFQPSVILVDAVISDVQCFGGSTGSILLTVNGGSGVYTYLWTGSDTTFTTPSLENIPAGSYQLLISDDLGNIFIGGYSIQQPSAIVLDNLTVVDNLCFGELNGSVLLSVSGGVAPYLYSWNGLPPQPENFYHQLPAGIGNVVITDANGCELIPDPYLVQEPDQLLLNSITVLDASGPDQNNGTIALDITGGTAPYQVLWTHGANGASISGLLPGEYTYQITDANGCRIIASTPVIVSFSTSTDETIWPEHVTIQPNPTNGDVSIIWTEFPYHDAGLSIYTPDGKLIENHIMTSNEGRWDLTHLDLSGGLYIILLRHQKRVYPFKLIVL